MCIGEGRFLCNSIQELKIGGRQSLLEGVNFHFGWHQFTFWRRFGRKGGIPQKGGTLGSRDLRGLLPVTVPMLEEQETATTKQIISETPEGSNSTVTP